MKHLRQYIRELLTEATEYDDHFKPLMDSGYDGIKQAIELADSLGIPPQELPWDYGSVDAYILHHYKQNKGWLPGAREFTREDYDEYLEPTNWTYEDWIEAGNRDFENYERDLGLRESRFKQMSKSKFTDLKLALASSSFLDADPAGDIDEDDDWSSDAAAELRDTLNDYFDDKFGVGNITGIVKVDMMPTSSSDGKDAVLKGATYYFEDGLHFIEVILASLDDGPTIRDMGSAEQKVYEVIMHELLHMQQFMKFSRGNPTTEAWNEFKSEYERRGGSHGMGADYFFFDEEDSPSELETFSFQLANELVDSLGKEKAVSVLQKQYPDHEIIRNNSASFRDIEKNSDVSRPEFREMLKRAKQYAKRI
jgi:hypothetical protein|tara:strand:+ start:710 stop:1807 length:1098 start_codon:yes stop_codon:yes gene_type:complete